MVTWPSIAWDSGGQTAVASGPVIVLAFSNNSTPAVVKVSMSLEQCHTQGFFEPGNLPAQRRLSRSIPLQQRTRAFGGTESSDVIPAGARFSSSLIFVYLITIFEDLYRIFAWLNRSMKYDPTDIIGMTITAADFWDQIAPKYSQQAIADPET